MPALNPQKYLVQSLGLQHDRLINDLKALPLGNHAQSYAGCAHSPLHMVTECALVNLWMAKFLQTGDSTRRSQEEQEALYNANDTAEKALSLLQESVAALTAAYQALDETTLGDISDKPLGRPVSRFGVAELPIYHMMYHDGQLNYIQTLLGDDQIHW